LTEGNNTADTKAGWPTVAAVNPAPDDDNNTSQVERAVVHVK